tara:strand:+ start:678 stop:1079 length:402 start_codon:yes stop_codon:yes gene_type:complete
MTIGKPLKCYPFKKKDGTFIYLPYDKTEFDLTFKGEEEDLLPIKEYWRSIRKPKYDPRKSLNENLMEVKNFMGFWPEPFFSDKIVQTMLLEYEDDNAVKGFFKEHQDYQVEQEKFNSKKHTSKRNWVDDDIPF